LFSAKKTKALDKKDTFFLKAEKKGTESGNKNPYSLVISTS